MKSKDFADCLTRYFTVYLPGVKNVSVNTIRSYRDTFSLFLSYCRDFEKKNLSKLEFKDVDAELIRRFLEWLETERSNSASSQNQRLAAIRAFFRYAQCEFPQYYAITSKILDMPFRKTAKPVIGYIHKDVLTELLSLPDQGTLSGKRDFALLCLLYDTGARVQEIVDLKINDIRLESPAVAKLTGKGRKTRIVPLLSETEKILREYLSSRCSGTDYRLDEPLFVNRLRQKLTRSGVAYIVNKYAESLAENGGNLDITISPHTFRHTKAMHLIQADINIIYIRDLLGHTDIKTTEVYARADTEMKRRALEKLTLNLPQSQQPSWIGDRDLLGWLNGLCRE